MTAGAIPFRWDLSRREQLGRLPEAPPYIEPYPDFVAELRPCCVRVLALAGDSQLVFVGRSPESLFDYLSGVLAETSWSERLVLLNLSLYRYTAADLSRAELAAVRQQFQHLGLDPARIASGPRPLALVDVIASGGTLGTLQALLLDWAREEGVDPAAVRRRLRVVGLVVQGKNSPNTWRWYQRVEWAADYPRSALKSVSIPYVLWHDLGEEQKKVSRWNPPYAWGSAEMARPPRDYYHLMALREALGVFERGRDPGERERFAAQLAAQPEMRHRWLRQLVLELR
ncbi:MAG TPA: hypothetical protein VFX98_10235 [Longimicrobiaceae bacterium]|nr:hypothetical protein [Longimicrobiaceae bacterium]